MNRIVKKAPEHILEIIAMTVWGLCMKMKMSEEEARECVEQVKERRMGYLFENMEKMDIQAERRNTREALAKLAEAEEKAEQRVKEAVKEAEEKAEEKAKEAKEANEKAEQAITALCQKYGGTKEEAAEIFMKEYGLSQTEAEEKVKRYWKE